MKPLSSAFGMAALLLPALASANSTFIQANHAKQRVASISTVPSGKFTIDGDLGDWADVPVRNGVIDDVLDHSLGPMTSARGAATFRFAHDDNAVYLAIAVADPSLVASPDPAALYNGDAAEIFLDFRSGDKLGEHTYGDGCYQILVAAPVDGQPMRQMAGNLGGKAIGPYEVGEKAIDGGYSVEIKIPYSSIAGVDAARMTEPFGFDVSIDDFDILPDGKTAERVSWCWSGDADQWENASVFGIADPSFTDPAPAPLLRTVPAVYEPGTTIGLADKAPVLVAGAIAPLSTSMPSMDFKVGTLPAAKLGQPHTETHDYPGLGVTINRAWWTTLAIPAGPHKAVTSYAAGLKQTVRFEAIVKPQLGGKQGKPFASGQAAANKMVDSRYVLPNGWRISPAGKHIKLPGDMPQSFVWLDATHLAVNTGGYHDQGVDVIDVTTNKVTQTFPVKQTWGAMAIVDRNELVVPGGHAVKGVDKKTLLPTFAEAVHAFHWDGTTLTAVPDVPISPTIAGGAYGPATDPDMFVAGVAARGPLPYLLNINTDKIYGMDGNAEHGYSVRAYTGTAYRPSAMAVSADGKSVTVANWGDASVNVYDPDTLAEQASYRVGSHPVALTYSPKKGDGRLFVACSGSNEVDIIDGGQVTEAVKTSLDPSDLVGSTPVAVAVSPDAKRLYVANADNNDVCVVDISAPGQSRVIGFIPTGWYPSALTVSPDGRKLYIATGKGLGFSANPKGKYIAKILSGDVSVVTLPDAGHLAAYTKQVVANNMPSHHSVFVPASKSTAALGIPGGGKIKHVVYIIRENRTYDQVLGDDPRGNGDPSITMFGKDVTPNIHQLVKDYVLLDNVYCNGEVSESGHQWCDSAYATDFVERAWVNSYSSRSEPDADDRLTASPAGYLWDNCARHGMSYYSYGEFSSFQSSPTTAPIYTGEGTLRGHCNPGYGALAWTDRDTLRSGFFIKDLKHAEKTGVWPSFMVMSLPEDHTHGLSPSVYTPPACVASNDLAVGQIVEAVSHSRFWKDTAIFIIEDDAQDGPDHVDAHRTVALVISPYVKHGGIDHTMYTTASFVRTMEDILGLPPMTQYDKNATPLYNAFDTAPVMTAWAHVAPHIDVMAKNQAGPAAIESAKLDFSAPDRADPDKLNALLWHALKPGVPMPAPVRSGALMAQVK